MRVGFGVSLLARCLRGDGIDGIGRYTRALGAALRHCDGVRLDPVTFGWPFAGGLDGLSAAQNLGRFAPRAVVSELLPVSFPGTSDLRRRIDVFHATDHFIPRLRGVPVVATLMDAIPLSHPQWVTMPARGAKNWLWRRAARRVQRVITVSEHSKREIVDHFGLDGERVSIVPLGVDARHFDAVPAEIKQATRNKFGLGGQFFLFIGTLQPRKNLERLIAAHATLPSSMRRAVPLVIAGREGWGCDALMPKLRGAHTDSPRWLRYVSDEDARALMQCATALVMPSLYEGFGLPVIEAFAAGLPVIASSTTALREVAGDAAFLVEPTDVEQIAMAMRAMIEDDALRAQCRERGWHRAREYTWDRTAAATVQVYRQAAALS